MRLTEDQRHTLRDAVSVAIAVPGLVERITAIYADVQAAIDARKPRCDISGRCCQFETFGHLLFVTTAELAAFGMERPDPHPDSFLPGPLPAIPAEGTQVGCPYQIDRKCSVHTIRPFGCRIYFCDPTAQEWQQDQYEQFHLRLKQLHDELAIPYLYVEWRQGLKALALSPGNPGGVATRGPG